MKVFIPVYNTGIFQHEPPSHIYVEGARASRIFSTREKAETYIAEEDAAVIALNSRFNANRIAQRERDLRVKELLEQEGMDEEDILTYVYVQSEEDFQKSLVKSERVWHIWEVEVD